MKLEIYPYSFHFIVIKSKTHINLSKSILSSLIRLYFILFYRKAETEQKELKLLLDMYKSINRDKRENHQLMLAEKKLKSDIEDTKAQMRRILVPTRFYFIMKYFITP